MTGALRPWSLSGRIGRSTYFIAGLVGLLAEHNLGRWLAHEMNLTGGIWNYWNPILDVALARPLTAIEKKFLLSLFLMSFPFLWLALTFTVKRLRDARQPLWLVVLVFEPVVNLLFFAVFCALSSREPGVRTSLTYRSEKDRLSYWPKSRFGSAALGAAIPALLGTLVTWFDLRYLGIYGLSLFIALPFVMGYLAVWVHCRTEPRGFSEALIVASIAIGLAGAGIVGIAIEGVICVIMAAPIAWGLSLLGGIVAYAIHNPLSACRPSPAALSVLLISLPALFGAEQIAPPPIPRYQVHTTMEIAAPPQVVWKRLVAFPPIKQPPVELPFRLGIAYPLEARLTGEGLTADRECRFSTGSFKEPILAWEPGKHLAFSVADEPMLMTETSPYRNIHVRHLDDHDFQPERADFVLVALPDGGTRLEGTTTYQNKMWPGIYWRLWTDTMVHSVHHRVFLHIKQLAEEDAHTGSEAR